MFIQTDRSWVRVSVLFFILTVLPYTALAIDEEDPLFATADLEQELRSRFGLKSKEMDALRPLIRLDNQNAALLYIAASHNHEADYMFLWEKVRRARGDFESSINMSLPARQRSALKVAHAEFENRILTFWMDDYVVLIAGLLELDSIQLSVVRVVFDVEREKRRRLLGRTGPLSGAAFDAEWERLESERDDELGKIFSVEQMRTYRTVRHQPEPWIA